MKPWKVYTLAFFIAVSAAAIGRLLQQHFLSTPPQVATQHVKNPFIQASADVTGKRAPDIVLTDMEGRQRSLSEWRGQVIAVNFWASWCAPCREEIPLFVELQRNYGQQGLQFVGIALQAAAEIRDFINEFGMSYPALVGREDAIRAAQKLGNNIGVLPYTVIIDRDGIIRFTKHGKLTRAEAERAITSLL